MGEPWEMGLKKREDFPQMTAEIMYLIFQMAHFWVDHPLHGEQKETLEGQRDKVMKWVLEHYMED